METEEQTSQTPQLETEPVPQPLSYAECCNLLLESRERIVDKLNKLETLQRKLVAARTDSGVRIYCWDDGKALSMKTVEKPIMGYAGINEKTTNPTPEGAKRITSDSYDEQLKEAVSFFQGKLGGVEEQLETLENSSGGKGIRCFKIGSEVEIKVSEKGPIGLLPQK